MDEMVLQTQIWLNRNYSNKYGYNTIEENGKTGWPTIYALTRALQIELGISEPTDNFGPTTASLFKSLSINSNPDDNDTSPEAYSIQNQIYILQGALWCKGYNPTGFSGYFGNGTKTAIINFQQDAGLSIADGIVTSRIMKALLSMDAFKLLAYDDYNGDEKIRQIQQALNCDYSSNRYFTEDLGLVPCDGIYGRKTNQALIYALQIEEGISEPTGYFGPTTKSLIPYLTLGTENKFVQLLQYSLYCNGKEFDPTGFTGYYGYNTQAAVLAFQQFTGLPTSGNAGMQTWSSLLTSTGDADRQGTACDCSTTITAEKAQTLVNNGYNIVGRYLTGKYAITPTEFQTIINYGMNLVPIFEVYGYYADWFTKENGRADANSALLAAKSLGIPEGTIIYFAVDYDVSGYEITNNIDPYFKAINDVFNNSTINYRIGIYAPRYVCTCMAERGYTCSSFVCDMSTGFACNLGYSLPKDWAFDQISTLSLGSGSASIEIDNNIAQGRDSGCNTIIIPTDKNELMLLQANNNPLTNLLGFEFDSFEEEVTVLSTGAVTIKAAASTTPQLGNGNFTVSVNNGEITSGGVDIESALGNLGISLSNENTAQLSSTLLEIGNFEAVVSMSVELAKISLSIEVAESTDIFDSTISTAVTVTIEVSLFDDGFSDAADNVLVTIKSIAVVIGNILLFLLLLVVLGLVVLFGGAEGLAAACIALLLTKLLKFLNDNDTEA